MPAKLQPGRPDSDSSPLPFQLTKGIDPFVAQLPTYLKGGRDDLDEAVQNALKHDIAQMEDWGIVDGSSFLRFASGMLEWIPTETFSGEDLYRTVCIFYFILDQAPIGGQQTRIHPRSQGKALRPVDSWMVQYARNVGSFMNTTASLTSDSLRAFWEYSPYNLGQAANPPKQWKDSPRPWSTYNELMGRSLKEGMRPIYKPDDDTVVVWPADSTFAGAWPVTARGNVDFRGEEDDKSVDVKGLLWTVRDLLHGSQYADEFKNGTWMHALLGFYDYHRVHAPVAGTVLEAQIIQGLCGLEVDVVQIPNNVEGKRKLQTRRSKSNASAGRLESLEATDEPGYHFLQTRGCFVIDNPKCGKVAVLPIGMAHVASVVPCVKAGDTLAKGDEIAMFQCGGSNIVLVFQDGIDTDLVDGQHYNVGQMLGKKGLSQME